MFSCPKPFFLDFQVYLYEIKETKEKREKNCLRKRNIKWTKIWRICMENAQKKKMMKNPIHGQNRSSIEMEEKEEGTVEISRTVATLSHTRTRRLHGKFTVLGSLLTLLVCIPIQIYLLQVCRVNCSNHPVKPSSENIAKITTLSRVRIIEDDSENSDFCIADTHSASATLGRQCLGYINRNASVEFCANADSNISSIVMSCNRV